MAVGPIAAPTSPRPLTTAGATAGTWEWGGRGWEEESSILAQPGRQNGTASALTGKGLLEVLELKESLNCSLFLAPGR